MLSSYHSGHQQFAEPDQARENAFYSDMTRPQPMSIPAEQKSIIFPRSSFGQQNLQAGRKRKESETDIHDIHQSSNQVRRRIRITRACDQCNQLRTKCDGRQPCAHCAETKMPCEYARAHKKRGRVPKDEGQNVNVSLGQSEARDPQVLSVKKLSQPDSDAMRDTSSRPQNDQFPEASRPSMSERRYSSLSNQESGPETYSDNTQQVAISNTMADFITLGAANNAPYYSSHGFNTLSQRMNDDSTLLTDGPQMYQVIGIGGPQEFGFPLGDDYSVSYLGKAPMVESPDWLALASPAFMGFNPPVPPPTTMQEPLRYPVLQPLLPHIDAMLPQPLACDLLEQYFTSTTSAYLRPSNPYVLGYVFRKKSILHSNSPRPCSPALLASMLWIAAQTSDAPFLNAQPDTRSRICQKLLELTISLLKPLVHSQSSIVVSDHTSKQSADDASLGALGVQTTYTGSSDRAQVDNISTYIHLATVVSASERKAASLRWWNAAWSLAREVRLGRELPPNPRDSVNESGSNEIARGARDETKDYQEVHQMSGGHGRASSFSQSRPSGFIYEEEREERRRVFWILYSMDRHLALCYNRPMFFLNKECDALLQPMDDNIWQAGQFDHVSTGNRRRGLNVECTAHSVFGFFLPLMVILGEILDLNHARNRPRLGSSNRRPKDWDNETREIVELLETYGQSLQDFTDSANSMLDHSHNEAVTPSVTSAATHESHATSEFALQTKSVVAYGTHVMHVLHILLTGKWDPIALLDDNDLWISSQSFVTATGHAVSAAEAVSDIIEYDPDLSFMPFFFGVYLLQGSFLLLLFADKLQGSVSPDVVKACETIVRAHEACVATLDTQYQRNFRKVMRSALQQVRGRIPEDLAEQQHRRREVLALYRWTGDGTGLAL